MKEQAIRIESYKVRNFDEDIGFETTETRFRIVSSIDGKLVDDAQGYGYKSPQKAYAAYYYKHRSSSDISKENHIRKWLKKHPEVTEEFEYAYFNAWKDNNLKEFNERVVEEILKEKNLEIDFTPAELLKVWKRGKK